MVVCFCYDGYSRWPCWIQNCTQLKKNSNTKNSFLDCSFTFLLPTKEAKPVGKISQFPRLSEASNMYDWINVTFHITLSLLYKPLTKTSFFSQFIFLSYSESYTIYIVFFTIKWRVEEDVCDDVEYWYRSSIIFYMQHLILFLCNSFL